MSIYFHTTVDNVVATSPCKLLSATLSQENSGTGTVRLYDDTSAQADNLVVELYQDGDGSAQFSWKGLEMQRGIYVEIVTLIDHVTVEWEPLPQPE